MPEDQPFDHPSDPEDESLTVREANESQRETPRSKYGVRRLLRLLAKGALALLAFSILMVFIYKFVPPVFTPLMIIRSTEALLAGKDSQISYDWTTYNNISPEAAIAVVASEDQSFPDHFGFDLDEIQKAMAQKKVRKRGASTISQQVAKNVFLWNGRSYFRKGLEAYFTVLIELIWGKKRILEVYLNVAEMGDRTFGVQAASQRYFGVSARQLSRRQAALLASVLPNPRRFSVSRPSRYVKGRANFIARQMRALGGPVYLKDLRSF